MVVDTDVIIRYLTNDDPAKADRLERYLSLGHQITLTDVTIAEIFWTISSFYKFPKEQAISHVETLLATREILSNKQVVTATLAILKSHAISYIDAYTAAYAIVNNTGEILSYDRGFDRIKGIKRHEP